MLAEELWECYEGGQGTQGLLSIAGGEKKKRQDSLFFSFIPQDLWKYAGLVPDCHQW